MVVTDFYFKGGAMIMTYIKHTTKNGTVKFYPIKENNIYVLCDCCKQMVKLRDPSSDFEAILSVGCSIEEISICDDCLDRL